MKRKYAVWQCGNKETGITEFFVSDITDDEQKRSRKKFDTLEYHEKARNLHQEFFRPRVASFPVSDLYPEEEQDRRAQMLRDYLNKIQEAKERAESETAFIDVLTAGANTNTNP